MNFKVTGTIKTITETKTLENGAKTLTYVIDTGEQYSNEYPINLYKSADKLEHFDNFLKYNKVGDKVTVEWNVRSREYKGAYYPSLNHWSIAKVEGSAQPKAENFAKEDDLDWLTGE